MSKQRIFSGIQPSGNIHLGNYFGAIKNWVDLQDNYQSIFCIVDLHAITVPQNPQELSEKTLEVAKLYLASGISARGGSASGGDPKFPILFIQSQVPEHAELMWLLNTFTGTSDLFKMTQFKDKSQKEKESENIKAGLLNYPILMAADILLYNTALVPVGEDQLQHLELTRKLGRKFNQQFGETFIIPKGFTKKESQRIMGLDDPTKKMSKSAHSEYNWIGMLDDAETIQRKIMKAVTDSAQGLEYSDQKPALKNLINIFSLITDQKPQEIVNQYQDKGYKEFKEALAQALIKYLEPIQKKYHQINDKEILAILKNGAQQAREIAQEKIKIVKNKMGLMNL
jgi:tryptophanyl-tRNA synthetase